MAAVITARVDRSFLAQTAGNAGVSRAGLRYHGEDGGPSRGDIADIRGDIVEIRDDIRVMRSDISDLRERTARIEVHVGVMPESR